MWLFRPNHASAKCTSSGVVWVCRAARFQHYAISGFTRLSFVDVLGVARSHLQTKVALCTVQLHLWDGRRHYALLPAAGSFMLRRHYAMFAPFRSELSFAFALCISLAQ